MQTQLGLPYKATLDACDPSGTRNLRSELGLIKENAAKGISPGRVGANNTSWSIWATFCRDLTCDPFLQNISDPMPLLQIFANRYRSGALAPSCSPVRSRTVEAALRAVGQTFSTLGYQDPRLQSSGKLDIRLQRQLQAYSKDDPPPSRVKPIPLQIIQHVVVMCARSNDPKLQAISHMIILGFFFLLRPGEYAFTDNPDAAPFRLCDIHVLLYNRRLDPAQCLEQDLDNATHIALEFTRQKNGVRGELVGLGRSGHPTLCPVKAAVLRIKHLRIHRAHPNTPIYSFHTGHMWRTITTTDLTQQLRLATTTLGHTVGIHPADISIRSLRSSGAMALLCADVDSDRIRLLGRWRSDEMLRYLHVQALPVVAPLARQMVQHGFFTFLPNTRLQMG
jgi:hypothetical protein